MDPSQIPDTVSRLTTLTIKAPYIDVTSLTKALRDESLDQSSFPAESRGQLSALFARELSAFGNRASWLFSYSPANVAALLTAECYSLQSMSRAVNLWLETLEGLTLPSLASMIVRDYPRVAETLAQSEWFGEEQKARNLALLLTYCSKLASPPILAGLTGPQGEVIRDVILIDAPLHAIVSSVFTHGENDHGKIKNLIPFAYQKITPLLDVLVKREDISEIIAAIGNDSRQAYQGTYVAAMVIATLLYFHEWERETNSALPSLTIGLRRMYLAGTENERGMIANAINDRSKEGSRAAFFRSIVNDESLPFPRRIEALLHLANTLSVLDLRALSTQLRVRYANVHEVKDLGSPDLLLEALEEIAPFDELSAEQQWQLYVAGYENSEKHAVNAEMLIDADRDRAKSVFQGYVINCAESYSGEMELSHKESDIGFVRPLEHFLLSGGFDDLEALRQIILASLNSRVVVNGGINREPKKLGVVLIKELLKHDSAKTLSLFETLCTEDFTKDSTGEQPPDMLDVIEAYLSASPPKPHTALFLHRVFSYTDDALHYCYIYKKAGEEKELIFSQDYRREGARWALDALGFFGILQWALMEQDSRVKQNAAQVLLAIDHRSWQELLNARGFDELLVYLGRIAGPQQ